MKSCSPVTRYRNMNGMQGTTCMRLLINWHTEMDCMVLTFPILFRDWNFIPFRLKAVRNNFTENSVGDLRKENVMSLLLTMKTRNAATTVAAKRAQKDQNGNNNCIVREKMGHLESLTEIFLNITIILKQFLESSPQILQNDYENNNDKKLEMQITCISRLFMVLSKGAAKKGSGPYLASPWKTNHSLRASRRSSLLATCNEKRQPKMKSAARRRRTPHRHCLREILKS